MSLLNVIILAVVQGLAELLPVSSSTHVIMAGKLLRLDPSSPPMTLLLVMLHAGTMLAVIVYFWRRWREAYFSSWYNIAYFLELVIIASALTAGIGAVLVKGIVSYVLVAKGAQVEDLFGRLELIAPALALAGLLILVAGIRERRHPVDPDREDSGLTAFRAGIIGAVQGLSLPFRGFSRSGATISTGMLLGVSKERVETFSFALAVVLTPAVVGREALRVLEWARTTGADAELTSILRLSLLGAAVAFVSGLLALRWLSHWLARGRWSFFGIYCLLAAAGAFALHRAGY